MPVEIEVSFRMPSALVKERLSNDANVVAARMREPKRIDMMAEYYDSPTHELRQNKSTLRRRVENGVPCVTFKKAAHAEGRLFVRNTWECRADEVSAAIVPLMDMGAPPELLEVARKSGFVPRGRFKYTRQNVPLMLPSGTSLEMDFDEGVINADGKQSELNEVLFKLLYGDLAELESFVFALEEKYGLERELSGKYDRALRLIRSR